MFGSVICSQMIQYHQLIAHRIFLSKRPSMYLPHTVQNFLFYDVPAASPYPYELAQANKLLVVLESDIAG